MPEYIVRLNVYSTDPEGSGFTTEPLPHWTKKTPSGGNATVPRSAALSLRFV